MNEIEQSQPASESPEQLAEPGAAYESEVEAWRLASLVLNALAVVLSLITIVGIL